MKKIVLATTVATTCLLPMAAIAGTSLYGDLRYSINSIDDESTGNDGLVAVDNVSKFGLKGSYGEGVKAFFHLQTAAAVDSDAEGDAFNQRFYMGGLEGSFGQVAYGRMTNAYKAPSVPINAFSDVTKTGATGSHAAGGMDYGMSNASNSFTNNTLQYTTPNMGGIKATVALAIDDSNEDEHGYAANVMYTGVKNLTVGVAMGSTGEAVTLANLPVDSDALRLVASYKLNSLTLGFNYENIDDGTDDTTFAYLSAVYGLNDKLDLKAAVGMVDDGGFAAEGTAVTLGAFYKITEGTEVYALASSGSMEVDGTDTSNISIGAIHKFSLGN